MFRFSSPLRWASSIVLAISTVAIAAPLSNFHGAISDPSGAVIPNAQVELLENGVQVASVATDEKGHYSISWKLEPGLRLRVSDRGFRTMEKAIDAQADAGESAEDIVLQLASFSDQIAVTSTGSPTPQAQLGAAVTMLDSDDYRGARDIQEGLRLVPGLEVAQTGQAGGTTSIYIRGCCVGSNGVSDGAKVLIDGIPVNDIGGAVEFANIASASVAQVEVLRGPNSALYGSDALAGVISLTTARGNTPLPLFTYQSAGGNFGTFRQEGSLSGRQGKFDYFSDYARFGSSNSIPDDKYHNGTFAGNFGWSFSPASSLRATVHHDQVASGQPGAIELYGLPANAEQANEDAYYGVTWDDKTTANWHNQLQYGGLRLRSQFTEFAPSGTPDSGYTLGAPVTIQGSNGYAVSGQALEPNDGPPYPYAYPGSTDKDFVYAQSDYRINPHLLGLVAFRFEDERGYSGGQASSIERGNYSYTFQFQGDVLNRLFYSVGSGLEDNGLFGIAGTPRASLAWQVARKGIFSGTKLRASFGEGIKEPALFDQLDSLYTLLSGLPASPGSPSGTQLIVQYHVAPIGPENSRSYDGGIDELLLNGRSRVSLTLFHNEFTNGVEYVPPQGLLDLGVPSAIAAAAVYGATVNSEAYRSQGLEVEIEHQATRDLFVRAGYTYVDARIQRSFSSGPSFNPSFPSIPIGDFSPLVGARPFRIAPHTGYFEAGYRRNRFFAVLRGTLVGSRDDSDFLTSSDPNSPNSMLLPNRNLDGAYQRLDLTSSYQANRYVAIEGDFQNLLSEHYSEVFGYPSLPFMFRLGMKFTLGGESWWGK
jgi:iron complex outermembrane receptor protein/vitamin B12 transporter